MSGERKFQFFPSVFKESSKRAQLRLDAENLINILENGDHTAKVEALIKLFARIDSINERLDSSLRRLDGRIDSVRKDQGPLTISPISRQTVERSVQQNIDFARTLKTATVYYNIPVVGLVKPEDLGHLRAHGARV